MADTMTHLRALAEQAVDQMLAGRKPCNCDDAGPVGIQAAVEVLDEYDAEHDVIVAAGGMPGNLTAYWARGEGAAKIRWGTNGAFNRCVSLLGEHVDDPKGACANLEKNATGHYPGSKKVESNMATTAAAGIIPPVEDSDEIPQPPGQTNEPPLEAEEEVEQAEDERIATLEDRIDRLEQDMARVLAVTNPDLEEI